MFLCQLSLAFEETVHCSLEMVCLRAKRSLKILKILLKFKWMKTSYYYYFILS